MRAIIELDQALRIVLGEDSQNDRLTYYATQVVNEYGGIHKVPQVSDHPFRQAFYTAMRIRGESHNLAEMCALQQAPKVETDNTFMHGHCCGNQFEKCPEIGDYYAAEAKAAGVSITGKVYKSSLARWPGDPEAWISGTGDVQRICEERGWGVRGSVNIKRRDDVAPIEDVKVADDIAYEKALDMIEADPGLPYRKAPRDILAEAKEAIKPDW